MLSVSLTRPKKPSGPNRQVRNRAPGARLVHKRFVRLRVPNHRAPCNPDCHALHKREQPLALVNKASHERVQLDDHASRVKDGRGNEIDNTD